MKRSSLKSSPANTAATPTSVENPAQPASDDASSSITTVPDAAPVAKVSTAQATPNASSPKPRAMHFRSQLTAPLTLRPSLSRNSQLPAWAAPFFASVPALLLGAYIVVGASAPLPQPAAPLPVIAPQPSTAGLPRVPLSRTLLVKSESSGGSVILRGRVQPQAALLGLAGDADDASGLSNGRAQVNGTIERVWVKPGDFVQAGQMVVQISTGAAVRPAPRTEAAQSQAEAAQVAAAKQQDALDQGLEDAQTRLLAAQTRVKQAQVKVDQARDIVRHLSQGTAESGSDATSSNALTPPAIPTPTTSQVVPVTPTRAPLTSSRPPSLASPDKGQQDAAQRERDALLRDVRRYTEDAEAAEKRAKSAQDDATKAEAEARTNKDKVPDLQAKLQAMQKAFDGGGAKGSEVEAARAAVEDAQNEANSASTRALLSRQEADRFRAQAQVLRGRAQDAQKRATATLSKLQLFSDENQRSATPPSTTINSSPSASRRRRKKRQNRVLPALPMPLPAPLPASPASGETKLPPGMTVQEAAKLVRSAVAESEAALADAHRIEREVADYKKRVSSTTQNLETSSKDLRDAQNRVLATGVRTVITTVHARTAGIVQSVASLAQNVGPDDVVFTVKPLQPRGTSRQGQTPPRLLEARIPAPDGIWRTIHPQQTLPALLVAPSAHSSLGTKPQNAAPQRNQTLRSQGSMHGVLPRKGSHTPISHQNNAPRSGGTREQSEPQLPPHLVSPSERMRPGNGGTMKPHAQTSLLRANPAQTGPSTSKAPKQSVTSESSGISVTLSVRDVAPPTAPGAPAIVHAAVNYQAPAGSDASKLLSAGAGVLCSVPRPGSRSAMRVPVSAIWRDENGTTKIAVLRTLPDVTTVSTQPGTPGAPQDSLHSLSASLNAPSLRATETPSRGESVGAPVDELTESSAGHGKVATVEWRTVVTGSSDGVLQVIVSGLQQGDRIVLDPQTLMIAPTIDTAPAPDGEGGSIHPDDSATNNDGSSPREIPSSDGAPQGRDGTSGERGDESSLPSPITAPSQGRGMQPMPAERVLLVRL